MIFRHEHKIRIVLPENMGKFPIELTEVFAVWQARRVALAPRDDRERIEQYAALDLWLCNFPHVTPLTDRFVLCLVGLEDIKGAKPAVKHFPEATHELSLYACNPDVRPDEWDRGIWSPLTPVNYVVQFTAKYPQRAMWVCERIAEALALGRYPVEPQGIRGAEELFAQAVNEFVRQSNND